LLVLNYVAISSIKVQIGSVAARIALWLDLSITRPAERKISEREAETSGENEPRVEVHDREHDRVGDPDVDEVQN